MESLKKMPKAKPPTAAQRRRWDRICALGCILCRTLGYHDTPAEIHHCGTGAGGRKDHDEVIGLCYHHHRGDDGIDAKHNGTPGCKRAWQEKHGTEDYFMELTSKLLGEL